MAEIIEEPSALSKIIPVSFKINDTDSVATTRLATKKQFNTTDTDAWLSFTLDGIDANMTGEFDLTMVNVDENPSSIINRTNLPFSAIPFHYKIDASADVEKNQIRHAGRWIGQVIIRLANGDTTTRQFDFAIVGHLLDGKEARLILIEDYNALMATITTSKDELAQYNIDYAALIETVTTQEAARVQAELTRAQTFDALVESEMIAQNVATKLTEKEATFAPRMLSVEQQLEQATTRKYAGQADFVDIIKGLTGYSRLRFKKISATAFGLSADNGGNHSTYNFIKDPADDFWKMDDAYEGSITKSTLEIAVPTTSGTGWVTASPPSWYTATVGDTFTAKVKGSSLFLQHRAESRGGIWSVVVDGDTNNPILVSTYSLTDITAKQSLIVDGLDENKYHTVLATFAGDDPSNPPSSGTGTARGWIYSTGALFGKYDNPVKNRGLLAPASNKEMAFSVTYNGATNWIPEHSAIPTAFNNPLYPTKWLIDDKEVVFANLTIGEYITCSDFKLVQRINGTIASEVVADISLTHHIDFTGEVNWVGNLIALKDIKLNSIYPLMLPLDQTTLNECLTSIGNSKVSTADEADYYFPEENDGTMSCTGIGSTYGSMGIAGTVKYPNKTMRIGEVLGKNQAKTIRFWQRAEAPKIYFSGGQSLDVLTGFSYSWAAKIIAANTNSRYYQTVK